MGVPGKLSLIGFCSKNPAPMLKYMDLLKPFDMYWFVTITPYGTDIEPRVPDQEEVMDTFLALSDIIGADAIGWRYDPILLNEKYTIEYHLKSFEHMATRLEGATKTCVISFIDLYQKVRKNFPEVRSMHDNYVNHNLHSSFLIWNLHPEDVIHDAEQKSWVDGQMSLFDLF